MAPKTLLAGGKGFPDKPRGAPVFEGAPAHSAMIPNSSIIGHHFSMPAFTSIPSASGVCCSAGNTSKPRSARWDRSAGSGSASMVAAWSLAMISLGVPLGAKSPNQFVKESDGSPN